ncbi:MAG: KH domain-containing protein, partial [Solirubrobacteraceae bacterium]
MIDDRLGSTSEERLEALLALVADALLMDATIDVELREGVLTGRLDGEDLGPFIGRRGTVINAVQHLAQRIAPAPEEEIVRVIVDADDYR